ncbi:hypothetical protein [Neobacillus sp. CF12]|nr:hypothetical protein [Neobacillus sp. CF12]MDM5329827.1 hypothetical protein [Neobacillus sp. CF12]
MGSKNDKEENEFFDIVKKAYDRGVNDNGVTVAKLIEDLKIDLRKMKVQ